MQDEKDVITLMTDKSPNQYDVNCVIIGEMGGRLIAIPFKSEEEKSLIKFVSIALLDEYKKDNNFINKFLEDLSAVRSSIEKQVGVLMGKVMKKHNNFNPTITREILRKLLWQDYINNFTDGDFERPSIMKW